jgi:hypothetical protein
MKLKQISVPIENSHDRLYEITSALGDRGINLRALNLVDTGQFGELRILVSDVVSARQILMQKYIPARIEEVVAVELEDTPGQLAQLLANLMNADVKVKYAYALAGNTTGKATMIFCFSDNDKAIRILTEKKVRLLDFEVHEQLKAAC